MVTVARPDVARQCKQQNDFKEGTPRSSLVSGLAICHILKKCS